MNPTYQEFTDPATNKTYLIKKTRFTSDVPNSKEGLVTRHLITQVYVRLDDATQEEPLWEGVIKPSKLVDSK